MKTFPEYGMSDIFSFHNGKTPKGLIKGKFPIYGSGGIMGTAEETNYENAIIIGRAGTSGSVAKCEGKFWASDNTIILKPKNNFDLTFLYYNLLRIPLRSYAGGSAQPLITHGILSAIKIPLPPLATQKRIAEILGQYDDLIENNNRRIALLEQAAKHLYKEWFVRFKFPGHEKVKIVDGLPKGWERKKLGEVGEIITGKTPSTKKKNYYGTDIPFVKTPDMHNSPVVTQTSQYLSQEGAESQSNKYIRPYSVMVSCIGTVGVVSMNSKTAQTNQQINTIIPNQPNSNYYLFYALKQLKSKMEAMGGGVTMPNVNKSKFESLEIIYPEKNIISLFSEFTKYLYTQIENLMEENQNLKKARDLLLPRFMRGELIV